MFRNEIFLVFLLPDAINRAMRLVFFVSMILLCARINASKVELSQLDSLRVLGQELYYKGNYQQAIHYFQQIKQLLDDESTHKSQLIICYLNLSLLYGELLQYDSSQYYFNQFLTLIPDSYSRQRSIALINMGHFSATSGDYSLAEEYYKACLRTENHLSALDIAKYWPYLYSNYGTLKIYQKDYRAALELLYKGLSYLKSKGQIQNLPIYSNIAVAYRYLNNFDSCVYYQQKSLEFARENLSETSIAFASTYLDFAENIIFFEKSDLVDEYLTKAEEILNATGFHHREQLRALQLRAQLKAMTHEFDSAIYYARQALQPAPSKTGIRLRHELQINQLLPFIHQIDILKDLIGYYIAHYQASSDINSLKNGLHIAETAMQIVDSLKTSFVTKESQLYLIENENEVFEKAHYISTRLYSITSDEKYLLDAFKIVERSKYAVLRTAIRSSYALSAGNIPKDLLVKERDLRSRIGFLKQGIYDQQPDNPTDTALLSEWQNELFQLHIQHQTLIEVFENKYPDYFTLKYDNSVRGLHDTQKNLTNKQTIVEYLYTDTTLYVYLLNRKDYKFFSFPLDAEFHQKLDTYYNLLRQFNYLTYSESNADEFFETGSYLYQKLIYPIESHIKTREVIIVPHAKLSFLPFEALPIPHNKTKLANRDNYLISNYAISYAYSSTLLLKNKISIHRNSMASVLCFAPQYSKDFNPNDYFTKRNGNPNRLKNLPGAIDEVLSIAGITKAKVFLNEQATESTFKQIASDYDILHFAMHTLINNESPLYSKMIFSLNNDSLNDGMLNTSEIFELQLKAKLAILSSCSTGEGEIRNGEGVLSLARGFHYAGCPSLVYTLWPIADNVGQPLMLEFYKNLLKGQNKNIALRNAKLHYIDNHPDYLVHPFFWSAYVCMGDISPIFTKMYPVVIILCLLILGIILAVVLVRKKIKKQ